MKGKLGRFLALCLTVLLLAFPGLAQEQKKKRKAATTDWGTTGLFKTWDAETLRQGEFNFSLGWNHYNRDPGELKINTLPIAFAVGAHDRLEFFAAIDVMKRIEADGIRHYRVLPGQRPRPAQTPFGVTSFNNEAPFIDVPVATGLGDIRFGEKFMLFSERLGDPLAVSLVGFIKFPTANSLTELNRGLGNGEVEAGYGFLFSKTAGNVGKFHLNTLVNYVKDAAPDDILLARLQHEFVYRGGGAFPAHGRVQVIAELDGKVYFGPRTAGANPRSPLDLIIGARLYPTEWLSFGMGYRALLNRIREDPSARIFAAGPHGLVAQLAFGRRINEPPTVTCAISSSSIKENQTTTIRANAVDPDGDTLTYSWSTTGGKLTGSGDTVTFDATAVAPGRYTVTATVSDGKHEATCSVEVTVLKDNKAPTVSCAPTSSTITAGESVTIRATASDPNNDTLTYSWTVNGQRLAADGPTITFGTEGRQPGTYNVAVTVSDGELTANCSVTVTVQAKVIPNRPPTIECLTTSVDVAAGGSVQLRVRASDPDGDRTTITWTATGGRVTGAGETATFDATGLRAGTYTVTATVEDGRGGRASCNITVNVSERLTPATFAPGSARVDNVAKAALDDIAVRMQNEPRLQANIIGYTDNTRRDRNLGLRRAQAVANYLKKKGIAESRLTVTDGGTSNPVADNKTAAGRKKNRRVEIEFTVR